MQSQISHRPFDRALEALRTLRQQEQKHNFASYKESSRSCLTQERKRTHSSGPGTSGVRSGKPAKMKSWTKKFMCLAKCEQRKTPTSAEKDILTLSGLSEKVITFPSMEADKNQVQNIILSTFLKFNYSSGGFEFMRCLPNSKDLKVIPFTDKRPILQLCVAGSGRIYIRPRCDLCVLSLDDESDFEVCSFVIAALLKCILDKLITVSITLPFAGIFRIRP